jgi:hypothetical protein
MFRIGRERLGGRISNLFEQSFDFARVHLDIEGLRFWA